MLTEENIRDHANTCVANESWLAQNNAQLYASLSKSLTQEGYLKIVDKSNSYQINEVTIGTLLFKLLMSKAVVNARTTASHLRDNLTSLDAHMASINSNIELFDLHVKENRQRLRARGECTDDLMINLFKGYAAASDREFASCIKKKKDLNN